MGENVIRKGGLFFDEDLGQMDSKEGSQLAFTFWKKFVKIYYNSIVIKDSKSSARWGPLKLINMNEQFME